MKFTIYFSSDLINFESLEENKFEHYYGGLVTVNDTLVAIGGFYTNKVEILDQKWKKIKPVPSRTKTLHSFSTLVINSTIYIFGRLTYFLL